MTRVFDDPRRTPRRRRLAAAGVGLLALVGALLGPATTGPVAPASAAPVGNPVLPGNQPDPTIEVFNGAYYIYATSSAGVTGQGGRNFFAWKSYDLKTWHNAGLVLDRSTVSWAASDLRTWAPDMVAANGKYYFYSAIATSIAVAVCDTPVGPCVDKGSPLVTGMIHNGVEAIDPMVFIDTDGERYLYFGGSAGSGLGIYRLNADMISLNGAMTFRTPQNFTEAPFMFKRNGTYYLQYSNGSFTNNTYNVRYSTSSSPLGPFTYGGQILAPTGNYQGPGHHAMLQYPGTDDWYMVYHRFQNADYTVRYAAIDRMYFNANGTIQPVVMTNTGVEERRAPGAPATNPSTPPQFIVGTGSKCVDVAGNDNGGNNAAVQMWDCLTSAVDQKWVWNAGTLRTLGKCLDIQGGSTANGAKLQLWTCNGNAAQQWVQNIDGTLRNPASGKCIDTPSGATANGTRLQIYTCNGNVAQKFVIGR